MNNKVTEDRNKYLREVRQIVFNFISPSQAEVYLFGSWAYNQIQKHSDIDLAILPKRRLPIGLLSELRESLEESHIPYRVEIIDLSQTDQTFRKNVLKNGVRWKY